MDRNNPQRYIDLICSLPRPENSDEDIWYFPPCREGESTDPAPSVSAHPRSRHSRTGQPTHNSSEAELSYSPPVKERINTPPASPVRVHSSSSHFQATQRGSQKFASSSKEQPLRSRRDRKPNTGLGRTNILNKAGATVPGQHGKVTPYTLFR